MLASGGQAIRRVGLDADHRHPHLREGDADSVSEEPMVVDDQDPDLTLPGRERKLDAELRPRLAPIAGR